MNVDTKPKSVAAEAAKPLYAIVGAGGLAVERARELAGRVRQADPNEVRDQVTTRVTKYLQDTGAQALSVYAGLTQRGERLLDELRRQPVVRRVLISAEEAVDKVEDALEDLIASRDKKAAQGSSPADAAADVEADDILDAEIVEPETAEAAEAAAAGQAAEAADVPANDPADAEARPATRATSRSGRKPATKK